MKLAPYIGDGNVLAFAGKAEKVIVGLKLAPYIGDGNIRLATSLFNMIKEFETSPVYRGRKLISLVSNTTLAHSFETSPVYRGRKLKRDSQYTIVLAISFQFI